jgi:hypothetical protein
MLPYQSSTTFTTTPCETLVSCPCHFVTIEMVAKDDAAPVGTTAAWFLSDSKAVFTTTCGMYQQFFFGS